MTSPLVSIVLCTYNGSAFLEEQLASILAQDYKALELVIVDDASTDDTWALLQQWQAKAPEIKLYRNATNLGYNKNFAKAIGLATGDYIAISDQDDIWMPQKISKLLATFQDPEVVLAHCRSVRLEDGRLRYKTASLHYHFSGSDTRKLFFYNQLNGHNMLFRKSLVPYVLPIPPSMMYDWWIAVNATCHGKIASVDEYLVHHRIHQTNSFFTDSKPAGSKPDLTHCLAQFLTIKELSPASRQYLQQLTTLLTAHTSGFDKDLFRFIYKHRKVIFGHKHRWLPEFYYLKKAYKYAKFDYRGKGITI